MCCESVASVFFMQGVLYGAQGVTVLVYGTDGLTSPPKDGTLVSRIK